MAIGRIKASPLAKKLASEKALTFPNFMAAGIPEESLRKMLLNIHQPHRYTRNPKDCCCIPVSAGQVSFEDVPVSQMRKVIAKRLAEVKFSAPEFYLTIQVDMDQAVTSRGKINETSPVKYP